MSIKITDIDKIDYAFQAIVNTHTGQIHAVEALIRDYEKLGFSSISDFFDSLYEKKSLYNIDLLLRRKALKKFKKLNMENLKLFYNIDNRIFSMPDFQIGGTSRILEELDYKDNVFCFEITEHSEFQDENLLKKAINLYKKNNFEIAIDDFGTGVSGLHLLYISEATYIKLDKFFIKKINQDSKKRLFCSSIIEMAHTMGVKVIAEGVETFQEYYTCKDIKVDYIQGFLISKPSTKISDIKESYDDTHGLFKKDRRKSNSNIIEKNYIDKISPLNINSSLHELFTYFKEHTHNTFVPIIDDKKVIIGVIYEVDIKKISYSQYGLSLAKNVAFKSKLSFYIKPVVKIEITWGIDKALEVFHMHENPQGIFVTKNNKYYGFINLNNLLSLSYKRNIQIAQSQNPLTKLPGNNQIDLFIKKVFKKNLNAQIVYFDFNDFKPFNDYYGFRQGDRAILLFSELLQKVLPNDVFIAHVGGDDFFLGFTNWKYEETYKIIHKIQDEFKENVASLYSKEDIQNNYIMATDRFGVTRKFNFLSVCAAIVHLEENSNLQAFNASLGKAKKDSKKIPTPLGLSIIKQHP